MTERIRSWLFPRRSRLGVIVAILCLVGVMGWLFKRETQPVYAGKPILKHFPDWTTRKAPPGGTIIVRPGAIRTPTPLPPVALNTRSNLSSIIGPEAAPWLMLVIGKEDSLLKRGYWQIQSRLPARVERALPVPVPASFNRTEAQALLFQLCRAHPKAVAPRLAEVLACGNRRERLLALNILTGLGPEAIAAKQALLNSLLNKDPGVRSASHGILISLYQLGKVREADEATISALSNFWLAPGTDLTKHSYLAERFCRMMAQYGPAARSALPALAVLLRSEKILVRIEALYACWKIDSTRKCPGPELLQIFSSEVGETRIRAGTYLAIDGGEMNLVPSETLPVMRQALREGDTALKTIAAGVLGYLGADAEIALPELMVALRDDDQTVRRTAAQTIVAIGPRASNVILDLAAAAAKRALQRLVDAKEPKH